MIEYLPVSMVDDRLTPTFRFEEVVLKRSLWVLRLDTLPAPNRFREILSRLSMDGRRRWPCEEGVVGAEFAAVRNLNIP